MKPEHAPAPHRLKYEVQHNTNVSRPFRKKERTKCRTAQEAGTRAAPPAVVGVGGVREQLRLGRLVLLDGLFWFSEQLIELLLREAICPANHACFHHHPRGHF